MLFELATLVLFWGCFKLYGLYVATAALMVALALQCLVSWFRTKKIPTMQWLTCLLAWGLGGSTLLFQNPLFIQWKPTVLYLLMSIGILAYNGLKKASVIEMMSNQGSMKVQAPFAFWLLMDRIVAIFLINMAGLNLYIVQHYSTEIWVRFKLFGTLGAMVLLAVFLSICISKKGQVSES